MEQGRGNKDLKRGGKLGQGVGALKRGGLLGPPYELCILNGNALASSKLNY